MQYNKYNMKQNSFISGVCADNVSLVRSCRVFSSSLYTRDFCWVSFYKMWGRCFYTRTRALNQCGWLHVDRNVRASVRWALLLLHYHSQSSSFVIFAHAERICFLYTSIIHTYNSLNLGPRQRVNTFECVRLRKKKSCLTHCKGLSEVWKVVWRHLSSYQCLIVNFFRHYSGLCGHGQQNNFFNKKY
jgi:hypothetical protein